jgi:putative ABC transport system permease protein
MLGLGMRHIWRYPIRSGLTIAGVATGIFLFTTVETLHASLRSVTTASAEETSLVVYRENRFCPFTSRLPEHFTDQIKRLPGVATVTPLQVVVNNCNASLDVVTFRGLPDQQFDAFASDRFVVLAGALAAWHQRGDAAAVGHILAQRRGLAVGDALNAAGVTVQVAAIIQSDDQQDNNSAFVSLPFLQQASRRGLGEVTQFNVTVDDPAQLEAVATAIDQRFAHSEAPTHTRPAQAFIAQTAQDMLALIAMTRWVGLGAVLAVVALVSNTTMLAVRGRLSAFAVLQTVGYQRRHIMATVVSEGVILGLVGGGIGAGASWLLLATGGWSLSAEGISLVFMPSMSVLGVALLAAVLLGFVAALFPAWLAARLPIVQTLRLGVA